MNAVTHRRGFTLTELLVTAAIILGLMTLLGAAVSSARNSAKRSATELAITKLDEIVTAQFNRYASRSVRPDQLPSQIANKSAARAWFIRRNMITPDMVDRWSDVAFMAANAAAFTSAAQRSYIATWNSLPATRRDASSNNYVGASYNGSECLFLTVMQGGFVDCLDCESLRTLRKGDKDEDGMLEFWDGWDEPIAYTLWAPAFMAKGGSLFFTGARALDADPLGQVPTTTAAIRPSLGMRPLIYSAGPDKEFGIERNNEQPNLSAGTSPTGRDCGNWSVTPWSSSGGLAENSGLKAADNISNLDLELGR